MNEMFIIDGTNLINVLSPDTEVEQRKLTPLLTLLLALLEQHATFFCYFDASTRFMFEEGSLDRQMYDILIGLRISDYFEQTKGGVQADEFILQQAEETRARVVSMDNFTQFEDRYEWLMTDADYRIVQADVIQGFLRVDKLKIKKEVKEEDIKELALDLINRLEGERGNLVGFIKKYDPARRFGLIKRAVGGPTLLFHRNQVIDTGLDYTVEGQSVQFKIGLRYSNQKEMFDFCAADVVEYKAEIPSDEGIADMEKLKKLEEKNKELQEVISNLKKRNQEWNETSKQLERKVETQETIIEEKDKKIEELEAFIRELLAKMKAEKAAFEQKLEQTKEETTELSIALDIQQQKIETLDGDLKEMLVLFENHKIDPTERIIFEKLKQNYKLLQVSLTQKDARITFLRNNINALHDELEKVKSAETVKDVVELEQKVEALELLNRALRNKLEKIEPKEKKKKEEKESIKTTPPAAVHRIQNKEIVLSEDLKNWWNGLTTQWQQAFNKVFFDKEEITDLPTEQELKELLMTTKLEILGERIRFTNYKRLHDSLKDLSGLLELVHLTELNLSGHSFSKINDLNHLKGLEILNLTSNDLRNLTTMPILPKLKILILRDNLLVDLHDIEQFEHLELLDISNNESLQSIREVDKLRHLKTLKMGYAPHLKAQIQWLKTIRPDIRIEN